MLSLRRRPSDLEFELELEAHFFGAELGVLEPRPCIGWPVGRGARDGRHVVGIFEVLDGSC
ncbi:hypothetical protein BDU57DRAFT_518118 [Ampelomyces quisqualis]|uniref:Uncharacterized protein n=1 Tax=Ampelomyces quisqualis TaxID=50730 RepID=A0A6A5QIL0_AMPQU|nr:hypothetical protein BDU57DRAFT_518118 [Ampelomyces quisqualis]